MPCPIRFSRSLTECFKPSAAPTLLASACLGLLVALLLGASMAEAKEQKPAKRVTVPKASPPPEPGSGAEGNPKLDPAQSAFFEEKIRPVLVKECYRCHSQDALANKKLKGDLFLDTREGLLKGGETGPALVPGKPDESLLVKALRHQEGFEMPPDGKLSDAVIQDFAKWIAMGAPDPRGGASAAAVSPKREIKMETERQFWSFQPLKAHTPPEVKNDAWTRTPIDRFILAAQEKKGLVPNAAASRQKLLRRVFFDVTGLPPTPGEAREFLEDPAPDAYDRLVERLLASPKYGERWARHWLDVVRYAESGGYEFDGDRPGAYHYRDWVVKSLNEDLPYDRFVRLQIAGDKLHPGDFYAGSATGFIVAGPYPGQITAKTVERIRYDQLDDMVATLGSSMLGLTVACARCHDHKYDPIPQKDYTRLLSVFGQTTFGEVHLDPNPSIYRNAKAAWDAAHVPFVSSVQTDWDTDFPKRFMAWRESRRSEQSSSTPAALDWVSVSASRPGLEPKPDGTFKFTGAAVANDLYTLAARTYQTNLTGFRLDVLTDAALPGKGPGLDKDGSFEMTELSVQVSPLDSKLKAAPITVKLRPVIASIEGKDRPLKNAVDGNDGTGWGIKEGAGTNQAALFAVEGAPIGFKGGSTLTFQLKFVNTFAIGHGRISYTTLPDPTSISGEPNLQNAAEISSLLELHGEKLTPDNRKEMARFFRRFDPRTESLLSALEAHAKQEPKPALLPVYAATPGGGDVFFLSRGEVDRKQGKADPGFMQVLMRNTEKDSRWIAPQGAPAHDARVALADWITDNEHGAGPLLARVMVNRLWRNHLGRGIVETPNDFGTQGDSPAHPELLDWLASELIRNGWHLKPIHRLILQSATYRQDGMVRPRNQKRDPENKLWWHRPAKRLEAEAIRDSLLATAGRLDSRLYGPGTLDATHPRRSIYLTVKRSNLTPFLQMFDAPEAIQSQGNRATTTLPTQALAFMNSPWVRELAKGVAQAARSNSQNNFSKFLDTAFEIALMRRPTPQETERFTAMYESQKQLLGEAPQASEKAMDEVCLILLCLNEFVYID